MEKNLDRRIQRTRKSLQTALVALILEKGYEAVTVQEVLERANVGRSTFYAHFYDKDDLLLSEFEALREDFEAILAQQSLDKADLWGFSLIMFRHAQSYHQVYKAVVGKQSGQIMQSHIQRYLLMLVQQHLETHAQHFDTSLVPLDILAVNLVNSFMSLLIWWLDKDMPYSAERMDAIYRQLTKEGVDSLRKSAP